MITKARIKVRWRAFKIWQRRPHQVAPMSEERHCCTTCGTEYQGNYCPRCGQSARIGRYSFKNAFLLFLDVWGLGNRGMFRTLRDLMLRPGYMIRDYLKGMQMAYFPPFKMFFLLTTLSLLVASGFNLAGKNTLSSGNHNIQIEAIDEEHTDSVAASYKPETLHLKTEKRFTQYINGIMSLQDRFPSMFSLAWLTLLSGILYTFFKRSPTIPDLRYSEFLVALVYTSNMYSIFSIIIDFLRLGALLEMGAILMPLVSLKQLLGFRWRKIIVCSLLAYGIIIIFIGLAVIAIALASAAGS